MNTRVSSEVTFIFTTGEKSVGLHADTRMQVHQGVSNPGVPKGPASEVSVAIATDPVKLGLGETANLPAA